MKDIIEFRDALDKSEDFNPDEIINHYIEFADRNNVFRSLSINESGIKTFGMRHRMGYHITGDTNREEEVLCQALFNSFNPENGKDKNSTSTVNKSEKLKIKGYGQYIIDYQTPSKTKQKDELWGKFDLIGLIKGSRGSSKKGLCFWEVKVGKNTNNIHFAVMELLIYFAQFDINIKRKKNNKAKNNYENFMLEAAFVRGAGLSNNYIDIKKDYHPILFIAADKTYYDYHKWNEKKNTYKNLKNKIKNELDITLEFIQIENEKDYDGRSYFYKGKNELIIL